MKTSKNSYHCGKCNARHWDWEECSIQYYMELDNRLCRFRARDDEQARKLAPVFAGGSKILLLYREESKDKMVEVCL